MARKTSGAKKVGATATATRKRTGIAVRLELPAKDHERLSRLAKDRGLSLASYARQALYERMKDDEEGRK
jgi:predicted HicB family RNase H-like nuclease